MQPYAVQKLIQNSGRWIVDGNKNDTDNDTAYHDGKKDNSAKVRIESALAPDCKSQQKPKYIFQHNRHDSKIECVFYSNPECFFLKQSDKILHTVKTDIIEKMYIPVGKTQHHSGCVRDNKKDRINEKRRKQQPPGVYGLLSFHLESPRSACEIKNDADSFPSASPLPLIKSPLHVWPLHLQHILYTIRSLPLRPSCR